MEAPVEVVEQVNYFLVAITALLGLSEGLALIPSLKANSIFQAIWNVLKGIAGK